MIAILILLTVLYGAGANLLMDGDPSIAMQNLNPTANKTAPVASSQQSNSNTTSLAANSAKQSPENQQSSNSNQEINNTTGAANSNSFIIGGAILGAFIVFVTAFIIYKKRNKPKIDVDIFGNKTSSPVEQWKNNSDSLFSTSRDKSYAEKSQYGESVFRSQIYHLDSVYMRSHTSENSLEFLSSKNIY